MEGSATGISRVSLRTCPKPTYSANMMVSFSKDRRRTDLLLKNDGFSFRGIPAGDSPAGTAPLAPAPAGDRDLTFQSRKVRNEVAAIAAEVAGTSMTVASSAVVVATAVVAMAAAAALAAV